MEGFRVTFFDGHTIVWRAIETPEEERDRHQRLQAHQEHLQGRLDRAKAEADKHFKPQLVILLKLAKRNLLEPENYLDFLQAPSIIARTVELYRSWYESAGIRDREVEDQIYAAYQLYCHIRGQILQRVKEARDAKQRPQ